MKNAVFTLFFLLPLAPALAAGPAELFQKIEKANQKYDKAFDYYAELCGTTQFKAVNAAPGGPFGHSVLLLKGVCRDTSFTDYPRVKACGKDGFVGISVDSEYANVNWTATDGRDFMIYGEVAADRPIGEEEYQNAIRKAVERGIFRNVRLTPKHDSEVLPGESYEQFVARWSLGTSFALNHARNLYCARVPLVPTIGPKDAMIKKIVAYLNGLNEKAHREGFKYSWQSNNCTHVPYNAIAQFGIWRTKETGWEEPQNTAAWMLRFKDLAVPMNSVYDSLRASAGDDESALPGIFLSDQNLARSLKSFGWIPMQPGVIVENIPVHSYENKKFQTDAELEIFDSTDEWTSKIGLSKKFATKKDFQTLLADPRLTDLDANLEWWKKTKFPAISNALNEVQAGSSPQANSPVFVNLRQYLEGKNAELSRRR